MDATTMQLKSGTGIFSALSYGIIPERAIAILPGGQANLRVAQASPEFWFCFEESETGLSYQTRGAVNPGEFLLVKLNVNRGETERSFRIGWFAIWSGNRTGPPPERLVETAYVRLSRGVYKVIPKAALEPGEYGIYYTGHPDWPTFAGTGGLFFGRLGKVFTFGVDAG